VLRVGAGEGAARCNDGLQYRLENLDISHKKSRIFVFVCMTLVVRVILMHRNATKSSKILGNNRCVVHNQIICGHVPSSPVSEVSAPVDKSHTASLLH